MTKPDVTDVTVDTFETTPLGQAVAEYEQTCKEIRMLAAERRKILGEEDLGDKARTVILDFARTRNAQMRHFAQTE